MITVANTFIGCISRAVIPRQGVFILQFLPNLLFALAGKFVIPVGSGIEHDGNCHYFIPIPLHPCHGANGIYL